MPSTDAFFRNIALTDVTVRVGDLAASVAFYRDVLGLQVITEDAHQVALAASGAPPALLVLVSAPEAPHRPAGTAGLFHVALLHPDRVSLAAAMVRLQEHGIAFGGADHGVSEALYLQDPEGNGLELYVDRAPADWPLSRSADRVAMHTAPLDGDSLLAAATEAGTARPTEGVRVGHVHLSVSQLESARAFYAEVLGFPVRQDDYPGALFFGRDGYHHHLATNTWRSQRAAPHAARGLAGFAIRFADEAEWRAVAAKARAAGVIVRDDATEVIVRDPDGLEIRLKSAKA